MVSARQADKRRDMENGSRTGVDDQSCDQGAAALDEVTALYRRVLELTLGQEACLRNGDAAGLRVVVSEKAQVVAQTQLLLADLSRTADKSGEAFQDGLKVLAALVAQVVAAEERCNALTPAPTPAPARRVLAAYGAAPR
jgi:hypothetical protein